MYDYCMLETVIYHAPQIVCFFFSSCLWLLLKIIRAVQYFVSWDVVGAFLSFLATFCLKDVEKLLYISVFMIFLLENYKTNDNTFFLNIHGFSCSVCLILEVKIISFYF